MVSNIAIVAISRRGAALARSLADSLGGDKTLYLERRFFHGEEDAIAFDLPLRPVIRRLFGECRSLILFMPVGAAVRLLAPCLHDKHNDPAVVSVDDAGRFAVSLLSGHVGGADLLAQEVARILEATAVITSASYVTGTLAVDLLGQEFGWSLEAEPLAVTRASAAVVNGEVVGIYQETGEPNWWPDNKPLPANIQVYASLEALAASDAVAALVVTDKEILPNPPLRPHPPTPSPSQMERGQGVRLEGKGVDIPNLRDKIVVVYRPRSLVVGMGCRRGVPVEELERLLVDTFRQHRLALKSLRCIATAELKKDEPGILQLAERYSVPVHCYGADELNRVFERKGDSPPSQLSPVQGGGGLQSMMPSTGRGKQGPTPSVVAHRLLGLWGVSEPAALISSGSRELLVSRVKTTRATIAVARMAFS
jgi:cobalt-precorrin 5A hydrolase